MDNVFKGMGKRLMQRIDTAVSEMLPRQARVVRSEKSTVWVRLVGQDASDPNPQFPSSYRNAPAGTMGRVITLGGKKGLFIAAAPPRTVAAPPVFNGPVVTISSAGFHLLAETVVSGMVPGVEYVLIVTGSARTNSSTATAQFSPRVTLDGVQQPSQYMNIASGSTWTTPFNFGFTRTAGATGSISVGIGVTWNGGTSNFQAISLSVIAVPT